MKKLSARILFIVLFFLPLLLPQPVSAVILFQDDFESGNSDQWTVISGNWNVQTIMGSKRYGSRIVPQFTIAESQAGDFSWTDYQFEVEITALGGEDRNLFFRAKEDRSILDDGGGHIYNWPQGYGLHMSYGGIRLHKFLPNSFPLLASNSLPFSSGTTHKFKIIVVGNNIQINVNDELLIDYTDTNDPILQGRIALAVSTGAVAPSEVYFDNILVTSLEPTPTPTPALQPLILLPGFGASWNHEAIILGATDKQPEDWYMTPGVKAYDGLIQTIENAGYARGNNFFVFNYDWRKPVEEIINDLEGFISRHPPPGGTDINLVGHSFGGLVARTYLQENPDAEVDKVLTLGSPHKGTPKAYYLWEGAWLSKAHPAWQRIALGILLQLHKKGFENNVETIQRISPSLKDLLPTFPYLKKWGIIKSLSEMNERNQWLEDLNTPPLPEPLISVLNTFVGLSGDTLHLINIKERSWLDEILGRWVDGKPIGEEYEIGDDTILSESARLEPAPVTELSGLNHRELVASETGQQEIMDALGLSPSEIALVPVIDFEPALVFQLASPVNITVYGPGGWQIGEGVANNIPDGIYSSGDKLIIIPNPKEGEYEARIIPEGDGGFYRLLIGKITGMGDIWTEAGGEVTTGETQAHETTFTQDAKKEKLELILLAKKRLEEANEKARNLRNPRGTLISGLIRIKIGETNQIIRLLRRGLGTFADKRLERIIINLPKLEENLQGRRWLYPIPPETENEIRGLLKEAKDYLLQAYDLE